MISCLSPLSSQSSRQALCSPQEVMSCTYMLIEEARNRPLSPDQKYPQKQVHAHNKSCYWYGKEEQL